MRLTSKGQVTVPHSIREFLQVGPGAEVDFVIVGERVEVRPRPVPRANDAPWLNAVGLLRGRSDAIMAKMRDDGDGTSA